MIIDIVKVFVPSTFAFVIGILLTPLLASYLYSHEMWKKKAGKIAPDGRDTPIFNELHKHKEVGTPKMGGTVIWLSASIVIAVIWILSRLTGLDAIEKLDFLSRNQTWIPLVTLILGAFLGLLDDYMDIKGSRDNLAGGLSLKKRLALVGLVGLLCGTWFYAKLGVSSVGLPYDQAIELGIFFIPFFAFVMMAVYSSGVIDGLDGLAGGIFAAIFTAYAGIAFFQDQINLAAFCTVIVGGILAFLWFNIPPARFYMSETGSMALTMTLTVVVFMTDVLSRQTATAPGGYGILVLPIIALPLVLTSASVAAQLLSKKLRNGKKIFLVAPLHHHFEALGWPSYKVTMRYWIIAIVCAIVGMILAFMA